VPDSRIFSRIDLLTSELLPPLGDVLGLVLLDLGQPGLLLGLELEAADVLARVADALAGGHQGAVGLALGGLGAQDALAGLHYRGVHVVAAAELGEEAAAARVALRGVGRVAGRGGGVGCRGVGRHRGGVPVGGKEAVFLGLLLDRHGGGLLAGGEEAVFPWLLDDGRGLGFVAGEEGHFDGGLM